MDATTIYQKSQSSIKVMKMSKGYNWEIKVYGDDLDAIREIIKKQDAELRTQFTEE